ncbi:Haa1p PWA37_002607 [Arxiozyma heterogenica]|uniref:Copper-fist domain-containing protein n=1 Tax=Arxiozyma heterogenica TaxID=278026 RepID=A0AAN7WNC9_9SACH|nr:hypothetical protein RI543_002180 [Kazachstania heterogenica]
MVLINGVKYACERCIRGHRVTTCTHTDQPLMMIKPKGRPSTTCAYCKELRKNKSAKPPGSCTCGRQEKLRKAQKAKEEQRAKAKEFTAQNCTCGTQITCRIHSKRQQRKNGTHTGTSGLTQRKIKTKGKVNRTTSSVSLDSHLLTIDSHDKQYDNNNDDTSNIFPRAFLDSDTTGKISKEYHNVPSLVSISSLQSSQSLEPNFPLQNNQASTVQYSFLFENPAIYSKYGQQVKTRNNNMELNHASVSNVSNLHLNTMGNTFIDETNMSNNVKTIQSPTRSNIGEVVVPLEEYIPPNINGIGKVDDIPSWTEDNNLMDFADFSKGKSPFDKPSYTSTTRNGLLDMFSDTSSISTLSRANLLLQEKGDQSNIVPSTERSPLNVLNHFSNERPLVSHQLIQSKNDISNDNESVASVEVLSLMPSFMDIPENENDSRRSCKLRTNINPNTMRQRSSSIDRNHKYSKIPQTTFANSSALSDDRNMMYEGTMGANIETQFPTNDQLLVTDNINMVNSPNSNDLKNKELSNEPKVMENEFNISANYNIDTNKASKMISQETPIPPKILSNQNFVELDNLLSDL